MQITDIRIRKIAKEGKMKAVVSVTFDNAFVVHDIKVIDGEKVYLSQCQAAKHPMASIVISHIRLTLILVTSSRKVFFRNTKQSWPRGKRKQSEKQR